MNATELFREILVSGRTFRVEGDHLFVRPPPPPSMAGLIREHKQGLMDLLVPRQLSDAEQDEIKSAWDAFKRQHGKALLAGGWDRKAVFGDLDPTNATDVDAIPGVMALVMAGWKLERIEKSRLLFSWGDLWAAKDRGKGVVATTKPDANLTATVKTASFCPSCHHADLPVLPKMHGAPTLWLMDVDNKLKKWCQTCRAFIAATIPMPGLTPRQWREMGRAIEGKTYDVAILDPPHVAKTRVRK